MESVLRRIFCENSCIGQNKPTVDSIVVKQHIEQSLNQENVMDAWVAKLYSFMKEFIKHT